MSFLLLVSAVLRNTIEFVAELFSDLTIQRVIGAIIFLLGVFLIGAGVNTGSPDKLVLMSVIGLFTGGIGGVIIHHDFAKTKTYGIGQYSELDTLEKTIDKQIREDGKASGWHMSGETKEKDRN